MPKAANTRYWLCHEPFYGNYVIKYKHYFVWKRYIAFMLHLPSGWRCTVRVLQGWMVEVIRQLCDILFWCLAVCAPCGPSPPHLLIPSWNTCGQMRSLWLLTIKRTSGQWATKKIREWRCWGGHWKQVGEQLWYVCGKDKQRTELKRTVKEIRQTRWRKSGIVRFGPNGSYTTPAVTIKQQVDAIVRPDR